ncbi:P-aminobenzoate N-oxygenase AurF [Rivularia sp. PCC 7116]|uniref:diiron oxygenase n=1 Tax=Rivularia sp. PCC 7116 TaxID=373994 RepID=UPI00029F1214|nr:diiron oxygenase [Rivularia sp. PCC 7116]AFY54491.1 P-aminobenzoate N-oxygenase AurF [Rivularia sp. PCC 7116]
MNGQQAALKINYSEQESRLFSGWNEKSWIRSKPMRQDSIVGLPFSPDLVPLANHSVIAQDSNLWMTVLAYRLLAHLQFTTLLELNHVNPVCSALSLGSAPINLNVQQRNDALKIYCDEGGHALFVELFSTQVKETFSLGDSILGRPIFEKVIENIIRENQSKLSPDLIKLFFVTISETLVTKVLKQVPSDPNVADVVRNVIGDHAADEALHGAYFQALFPLLWQNLSSLEKQEMIKILPRLVWAFLGPDYDVEYNVLKALDFSDVDAKGILQEVFVPSDVAAGVKQAASPTLRMFEKAGVFEVCGAFQIFADYQLIS